MLHSADNDGDVGSVIGTVEENSVVVVQSKNLLQLSDHSGGYCGRRKIDGYVWQVKCDIGGMLVLRAKRASPLNDTVRFIKDDALYFRCKCLVRPQNGLAATSSFHHDIWAENNDTIFELLDVLYIKSLLVQ